MKKRKSILILLFVASFAMAHTIIVSSVTILLLSIVVSAQLLTSVAVYIANDAKLVSEQYGML